MRTVFLAPHLQDAVLSCGGVLAGLQARRAPCTVITVCAGVPEPADDLRHGSPAQQLRLRRAEDHAALSVLGVETVVHLELLDACHRRSERGALLYDDARLRGQIHADERGLARLLAQELRKVLGTPAEQELRAPLAVGRHVDHQLVHRAAVLLSRGGYRVRFYEDLPFAGEAGTLKAALARGRWSPHLVRLDEELMARKVAAARYYRTQNQELFGDDLLMNEFFRSYAARVAAGKGYAERLWEPARKVAAR